jgi:alpha-beta hydrolase superfamily lysophospholipase
MSELQRVWAPDVLDGFEQTTLAMPDAADGPVDVVVVRRRTQLTSDRAVLYVHGFGDYFFQTHLADFFEQHGIRFYAVDLRRHGRSLRSYQLPNYTTDVDEYLADVGAAVDLLVNEEGVDWLLLNGHSTGGLVAVLFADRWSNRASVHAVFLNSPFLDMNLPAWQEKALEPVLSFMGRAARTLKLPGLSPYYGQSVHADHRGEWRFDTAWKPIEGFPARAGWFRAIHRAQAEVARGLHIEQPVLLLHSDRSIRPTEWSDNLLRADTVLDIDDMIRLAPGLGRNVEVRAVPGGMHDLVLSQPDARAVTFDLLAEWLGRMVPA